MTWQFNEQKPAALLAARSASPSVARSPSPSAASLLIPKRLHYLPDCTLPRPPDSPPWHEPWRDAVVGQELCLVLCRQASRPLSVDRGE